MTGKHGAAGNENRRNVHAQGAEHHARNNLVAIGNAHGSIELMALNSAFEAVGDSFAGNERVMHAIMVHGNAVAHADGGNFERNATGHINAGLHSFANFIEVIVARNNVIAGIEHRDEGLLHFFIGKAVGLQQAAVGSTRHANFNGASLRSCIVSSFFLQALSLTQGMRSTEETSPSMPYHGRRRRCILTVARGGCSALASCVQLRCSREFSEPSTAGSQSACLLWDGFVPTRPVVAFIE